MVAALVRRYSVAIALAFCACFAFAAFAGVVRVLPWLVSRSVPLTVGGVFAATIGLASLEVVALVAAPVGAALASAKGSSDGSFQALSCLGISPARCARAALPAALACAIVGSTASLAWGQWSESPGRWLQHLLDQGKLHACSDALPPRVPLLELSWLCVAKRPRVIGDHSAPQTSLAWTATDVQLSQDVSSVRLQNVTAVIRSPELSVSGEFRNVMVGGFVPWIVGRGANPWTRAWLTLASVIMGAASSAFVVARLRIVSLPSALLVGVTAPAAFFLLAPPVLSYAHLPVTLIAPLACGLAPPLVVVVWQGLRLLRWRPNGTTSTGGR